MHIQTQGTSLHRTAGPAAAPATTVGSAVSTPPGLKARSAAGLVFPPQPALKTSRAGQASRPQWQGSSGQPAGTLKSLLAAIGDDDWVAVQQLRTNHPDIPMTPDAQMRYAAHASAGKVVFYLQRSGIDPFVPEPEASAFHAALSSGNYGIAQEMLKYARTMNDGALPDLGPYLQFALDSDDQATVSWLLQFSLLQRLDMPFEVLRDAIGTSNVRRIELLVGHPRLSDAFANHGVERSILHYAIRKGSADTVGFLLNRKSGRERVAHLCTKSGYLSFNALHLAVVSGDLAKLQVILAGHAHAKIGKDALNARNVNGKSPLALALEAGRVEMAELLLDSGAHPLVSEKGTKH